VDSLETPKRELHAERMRPGLCCSAACALPMPSSVTCTFYAATAGDRLRVHRDGGRADQMAGERTGACRDSTLLHAEQERQAPSDHLQFRRLVAFVDCDRCARDRVVSTYVYIGMVCMQ